MKKLPLLGLYLINLGIILYFWWQASSGLLVTNVSGTMIALARLSGLLAMFSVLVQYTFMSRNPFILRHLGLKAYRLHKYNGIAALSFVTLHVGLVLGGYSLGTGQSLPQQGISFIRDFPYVWLAAIAFVVMLVTVSLSYELIRRRLRPRVWYGIHVFNHTIVWLALWHQLAVGGTLMSSPLFRGYWIGLIVFSLSHMLFFRFVYYRMRASW